jgi:hypothetical protein
MRMDEMDEQYPSREDFIFDEVLCGRAWLIERNKFPYMLPPGVEHHTVWSAKPRRHEELVEWVENHLRTKRPDVVAWNYDLNSAKKTIDVFHVHVYLCSDEDILHTLDMCDVGALTRADDGKLPPGYTMKLEAGWCESSRYDGRRRPGTFDRGEVTQDRKRRSISGRGELNDGRGYGQKRQRI